MLGRSHLWTSLVLKRKAKRNIFLFLIILFVFIFPVPFIVPGVEGIQNAFVVENANQ